MTGNTLEGFNCRQDKAEELVIWKTGEWDSLKQSSKKKTKLKKSEDSLRDL